MRKTKKSKILSLILCMSLIISTFAFMPQVAAAKVKDFDKLSVEEQFEYLKSLGSDDEVEKAVKSLSDEEYKALESYINEKAKEEAEKDPPETVTFTEAGPFLPAVNIADKTAKKVKRAKAANTGATDNESDDGLNLSKKVTKNGDGTYKISLEAYTTGKVTTSTKTAPVDIVLVLDQSGSMAYDFDGKNTSDNTKRRQYAMKQAVKNFIDEVNKKYSKEADHRISVVTFGSDASTLQGWTSVDSAGKTSLGEKINVLPQSPSGATNVGAGMQQAETLMGTGYNYTGSNKERQKVVIVFTDGVPTTETRFDVGVANEAINAAGNLKAGGVTVYSVGIFNGANPEQLYGDCDGKVGSKWGKTSFLWTGDVADVDQPAGNRFLNYVSSNFNNTTEIGLKSADWWFIVVDYKGWEITRNFDRDKTEYYLTASDSSGLNEIFKTISEQIQTSDIDLGSETVIKDIVADQFTMPDGTDKVKVKSVACTGYNNDEPQWGKSTAITDDISIDTENKSVNVTGFDFNQNFVSKNQKTDGTYGAKLVIEFDISVKDGFLGGNGVKTNGVNSGIYEDNSSQTVVKKFEQPTVDIPIKDIQVSATDKNIYLLGSVTQSQLQNGISAKTTDGKISFDFLKENYGLESWQTEYVDIETVLKDAADKEIGSAGLKDLTADASYTFGMSITPKTEGSAKAKSASATGKINVFKPELTYKDSTVYYGDTAPTSYDDNKDGGTVWKHGETKAEDVTIIGDAPTLDISYDPAIGNQTYYKDGKISTKNDISVKATVKIGDTDVTKYVAFKHETCGESGCGFNEKNEQFLIHVKTCSLTVKKTGGVKDEPYVMNIYKDDELYTSMTIVGNTSETIRELPVGTYTVKEDTDWAWRYKGTEPVISSGVGLKQGNASGEIKVTNHDRYQSFLNGYSTVVKNIFGGSKSN